MKKVAGDSKSSTFQHKDGHQIIVAHAPLATIQRKQLEKMPVQKMADGGMAASPDVENEIRAAASHPQNPFIPQAPPPTQDEKYEAIRKQNRANFGYADGGDVQQIDPDKAKEVQDSMRKAFGYADGGFADSPIGQAASWIGDKLKDRFQPDPNDNAVSAGINAGMGSRDQIANDPQLMQQAQQLPDAQPAAQAPAQPQVQPQSQDIPQPQDSKPSAAPQEQAKMPVNAADMNPDGSINYEAAYKQGQNAISQKQAVDSQLAKNNVPIIQDDIAAKQSIQDSITSNLQQYQQHAQDFMNDIQNNHINPRHYVESMGTGQKVATAVGLLLGGFGGASGNPAQKFLDEQINRDISAQQSRLDSDKTLLGANQQMFGDTQSALNQTRVNMNDIYDRNIQLAASKLGTPAALAAAQAAHAQYAFQNGQILQQSALRSAVMQAAKSNGGQGLDAMDLARAGFIPPEEAQKEQASLDAQKNAIGQAKDLFAKMDAQQTAGNRIMNPIQSKARMDQFKAQLVNTVLNASASKRLNPEAIKTQIEPLVPSLMENSKTRENGLQTVLNLIQGHADPTPHMQKYAPGALPQYNLPQYKTVNGVKYMRGPKGEAIKVQ